MLKALGEAGESDWRPGPAEAEAYELGAEAAVRIYETELAADYANAKVSNGAVDRALNVVGTFDTSRVDHWHRMSAALAASGYPCQLAEALALRDDESEGKA